MISKLTSFRNPVSGDRGNLLNIRTWGQHILGVAFLGTVITLGLFLGGTVIRKLGVGEQIGAKRVF